MQSFLTAYKAAVEELTFQRSSESFGIWEGLHLQDKSLAKFVLQAGSP
jgi:hypothetical protein